MNEQRKEPKEPKPRIIKNHDIPVLDRVLYVMQAVCSLEKRKEWQRDRMYKITQTVSGMPGGGSQPTGFDAAYAALDGLNAEHQEMIHAYTRELKAAERIINSIPSMTMRTFVVMLYVDHLPDITVRRELNMTEYGFNRARDAIENAENMGAVKWHERYIFSNLQPKV